MAVYVTEVPAQTVVAEAEIEILTGSSGFTEIINGFETAGLPVTQVRLDIRVHVTTSPLTGKKVKVGLIAPGIIIPFTLHCSMGVGPPLTGTAVKVNASPAQSVAGDAEIAMLTGSCELTDLVIVFEIAGFPVMQVPLEVSKQEIASPLAGTKVYIALVAPFTFVPFTFHW